MSRKLLATFAPLSLSLLAACGAGPDGPTSSTGSASSAIQGGQVDNTDSSIVGVALLSGGGIASCSGSLIAPNVVLTAHHCVAPTPEGYVTCGSYQFGQTYQPGAFYVTTQSTFSYDQSSYRHVTEVRTAPGSNDLCGQDVAILMLDSAMPGAWDQNATPLVPRLDSPPAAQETYDAAGYGETCEDPPDASWQTAKCSQTAGTRRRINGLSATCTGKLCGDTQYIKDTEWQGDKAVCSGDSGGPALDSQGRVIGVASRGGADKAGNCLSPIYSRVDVWADFIKQAVLDGAQTGGYTPPTWATATAPTDDAGDISSDGSAGAGYGGACATGDDCASGLVCYVGGNGQGTCTSVCAQTTDCASGASCSDIGGGTSVCLAPAAPAAQDSASSSGGCSVAGGGATDPSKPVPWIAGLALASLLRRRRDRRG